MTIKGQTIPVSNSTKHPGIHLDSNYLAEAHFSQTQGAENMVLEAILAAMRTQ